MLRNMLRIGKIFLCLSWLSAPLAMADTAPGSAAAAPAATPTTITVKGEITTMSSQLKALAGSWKVIGCQLNTRWLPESIFREFRYKIEPNSTYSIDWSELTYPQFLGGFSKSKTGKLKLDENVKPNGIDLIPDEGPYAGKVFQGIFELDHDVLKANFAFPGKPRPTVFSADQGQVYEIWQRVQE